MSKRIHIIGGPTASGKSGHALELAKTLKDPVIINCDSMQIYDGMPTLTAQPNAEDKAQVTHMLYGTLHPNESCSAGNWREMVEPIIADLLTEGKSPIIVGGSGLYINALVKGLSPMPDISDETRNRINAHYDKIGNVAFFKELQERDPIMAARFHENHKARIIRAYEVLEATEKSLAEWQEMPLQGPPSDWEFDIMVVMPTRETLYERCNMRFEWMLDNGALEEIEAFNARIKSGDVRPNALLCNALGFEPLTSYINGEMDRETAITLSQGETRRYAKRQTTWFNNQIEAHRIIS